MQRQNVRVILASEYPEVRHFLREVVEEDRAVIVGQAQDASRALALAKSLRPDVAIVDCYLPHAVGLDTVPLSRMGGLDTAQTISEEIPNIRVILLNNLDTEILAGRGSGSDGAPIFSIKRMGVDTPFALQDLYYEVVPPNTIVFANVEAKPRVRASLRRRAASLSGTDMLFGGLGVLGGLGLILTLVLSGAGTLLAFAGAAIVGIGIGLLIKRVNL